MSEYVIDARDVVKRYPRPGGAGERTILNDVHLRVRPREFITVVGPSGCGKSTLLRLILGSELPSEGTLHVEGRAARRPDRHRGIVYQRYSLFPHLTVLENVIFGLDLEAFSIAARWFRPGAYRRDRERYAERASEYLKRMNLAEAADKYPHQLSGGMQQRVAIAQAAIMEPAILLMDEPFGALDDSTRQEMQLFILELWERSEMTILFVTHDLEEALFLGTRILVLSQYYSDDTPCEGAKLVIDREVPGGHPKPSDFRYSREFDTLRERVRRDGLDPEVRQHIRDFDLSHRDAWRSEE